LLTLDDSWATELLARGMPRAEAETAYGAHAITRWLGPDSPDIVPRPRRLTADGPGWLLLCSDGLWNYCSEPQDLAALVGAGTNALGAEAGPLTLAETLVAWANGHGGHDNITVALARLDPSPAAPAPLTDPTAGV
jgi:serine/threonine protein phosphatase PrpC